MFEVSSNAGPRPAPTHWSNSFSYRRREEATADADGKPQLVITNFLLEMMGVEVGDDVVMTITPDGALFARKSGT